MTQLPLTPAEEELRRKGISYRTFQHDGPLTSLEQAAAERDQQPGQVIRSIVFRVSAGSYVMVLIGGPEQINWRALRRYLAESRLTMASEEEVRAVTGYERGAVTPFGLPNPIRLLVDENVFIPNEVSLGSGRRSYAILLDREALKQALPEHEIGIFR